jgi:type II secretory pathway component PulF
MPTFSYKARRGVKESVSGTVEAFDRNKAISLLKQKGYFLLSLEQASSSDLGNLGERLLHRASKQEVAVCVSQLASLLKAGLPLALALKSLQEQAGGTVLARILEQLRADVSEGTPLHEAMNKFPRTFPHSATAAVRAGEEGGILAEVLGRLAGQMKVEIEVRGRIRGALAYPIFLLLLGALTVSVLLVFVIPRFTALFATMGEQLPLPTQILLGFSGFMDRYWVLVLLASIGTVFTAVAAGRQEPVRQWLDVWILKVPLVGSIVSRSETARTARTLAELLNSGVPILTGLKITQDVLKNRCFRKDLERLRDEVGRGTQVATAMARLSTFGPLIVNMTSVGEQSGQLPELLLEVADIYEKECERAIQTFTTILGPSLIVVLGGIVAFVITAILLPVFQASTMAG